MKHRNKRIESTKTYIDALSNEYSKLNIIRVDLAYKKPYSDNITLEEANKELDRVFTNMRSKPSIFKDKVGHVCKVEYTKDRGVHFHTMFIFDGQKVQNDKFKAQQVGEYWEKITDGKGSFHNCNRQDYKRNGLGILDHRDSHKRKILDADVISYLCKDEQGIEAIKGDKKAKAFTRGTLPKSKGRIGRPRD